MSCKQKGSTKFKKPKLKVAKIYKKIASYRFALLHKTPYQWVIQYDLKAAEDLKVKKPLTIQPYCRCRLEKFRKKGNFIKWLGKL